MLIKHCLHRHLNTGCDKDSVILVGKLFQCLIPRTCIQCERQVSLCDIIYNLVALRVESNVKEANLIEIANLMMVVTILNLCAKGARSSRRGHREVVQDETLQTKIIW